MLIFNYYIIEISKQPPWFLDNEKSMRVSCIQIHNISAILIRVKTKSIRESFKTLKE